MITWFLKASPQVGVSILGHQSVGLLFQLAIHPRLGFHTAGICLKGMMPLQSASALLGRGKRGSYPGARRGTSPKYLHPISPVFSAMKQLKFIVALETVASKSDFDLTFHSPETASYDFSSLFAYTLFLENPMNLDGTS